MAGWLAGGAADLQDGLQGVDLLVEGGGELPDLLVVAHVLQAEMVLILHVQLLHVHLQVQHLLALRDETHRRFPVDISLSQNCIHIS